MSLTIDLQPLVQAILPLAGIVVSILISYGIAIVTKKFKLDIEATHRDALQGALENAVNFGLKKAADAAKPLEHITTQNEVLATAANYVIAAVPDALNKLGVTDERLRHLLEARLIPATAAASPIAPAP